MQPRTPSPRLSPHGGGGSPAQEAVSPNRRASPNATDAGTVARRRHRPDPSLLTWSPHRLLMQPEAATQLALEEAEPTRYSPKHSWSPPWLSPERSSPPAPSPPTPAVERPAAPLSASGWKLPQKMDFFQPQPEPEPEPEPETQPEPQPQPQPQPPAAAGSSSPKKKPTWAKGKKRARTFTLHVHPNPCVPIDAVTDITVEAQSLADLQVKAAAQLNIACEVLVCPAVAALSEAAPLRALAELGSEEEISLYPVQCFEADGVTPLPLGDKAQV